MKDCNDCRELKYLLCDYLDNTLDEEQCRRFDEHIAQCKKCSSLIADMKELINKCKQSEKVQMPEDMKKELIKCINQQINKEQ